MKKTQAKYKRYKFAIDKTEDGVKYTLTDFIAIAAITLIYGIIAFINLGDTKAPQKFWQPANGGLAVIEFQNEQEISRMQFYLGTPHNNKFTVSVSADGETWSDEVTVGYSESGYPEGDVFIWREIKLNQTAKFVRLTAITNELSLGEIAFSNANGELIPVKGVTTDGGNAQALIDDRDIIPDRMDFMNSTIFDEIYHARTGYEYANSEPVYENTHPPLGKLFIALSIKIFGMTPFGWRFPGTFFGILMLPVLYVFARRLLKDTFWATFATVLFAADFMHYVQTRIATIDTYVVFFIICMYYFMYKYWTMSFYETPFKKTLVPLFFSGLFMGLAIASKWPGMYAGAGLAVLFFATLYKRYKEYDYAKKKSIKGEYHLFYSKAIKTCLWCLLFFVVIPGTIYVLSFVPFYFFSKNLYPTREYMSVLINNPFLGVIFPDNKIGNFLLAVIEAQYGMYDYHAVYVLQFTHPYSSVWWEWIFDLRTICYFANTVSSTVRQVISSFGNPLVWIGGFVSFLYCGYSFIRKHDKTILFLIIAYFAQLFPWVFVSRLTFIYHYFPSVPFLILMNAYTFKMIFGEAEGKKRIVPIVYLAAAVVLFAMFYPVLSGMPIPVKYVRIFLEWGIGKFRLFPHWLLI